MFYRYLKNTGIEGKNIIRFAFDNDEDIDKLDSYNQNDPTKIYLDKEKRKYIVNSKKFRAYIAEQINDDENFFILLDEDIIEK